VFNQLRTRLTAVYATLFVAILAAIALAVSLAASADAERLGRSQLAEAGMVFDRQFNARNEALQDEAEVLAQDYGFRSALGTHDASTLRSELKNLSTRLDLNLAFMVDLQGQVTSADAAMDGKLPHEVVQAVQDSDEGLSGLFRSGGQTYQAIATPVRAPATVGWLVFAKSLGAKDMAQLEQLSAIPLKASVVSRGRDGLWQCAGCEQSKTSTARLAMLIDQATSRANAPAIDLHDGAGPSLVFAHKLPGIGQGEQALLVRYPLAQAMQPFNALMRGIFLIGLCGVLLVVAGSWFVARTLTRSISRLGEAAERLKAGDAAARAPVDSADEIGALGAAFNAMADAVAERETSLMAARDRAEAADRAKGEFLANMNHELRTPLNGVLGPASVLSGTALDADQTRMVQLIQGSGEGLKRIVDSVLDLVELSAGDLRLKEAPFDLAATLRTVAENTHAAATAKRLGFALEGVADAGWVWGDGRRVAQILSSLLDNAVKFTDAGGATLAVSRSGDRWGFEVRDTGVGFDPKDAEALFDPFQQADGSMTRRFGGVGLGLSLARELARAMGGDVEARGTPGQGATFRFSALLPEAAAPVPAPSPTPALEVVAETEPEDYPPVRILLAEDNPANRTVVEMILNAVGVDLVSVENGALAVEAMAGDAYDLVLMDLQMPVMDGLTAIRLIREREQATGAARTPILVLSANVQAEHLEASAAAGADMHLAKPIVAPTLLAALEQTLSGPTAEAA